MKKIIALLVSVVLLLSAFPLTSLFAANEPIVFDFSKDGQYTAISNDEADGENWKISLDGGVYFMGKKSKTRISYEFDAAEGAAKFVAHNADPYFVSADKDGNDAELPAAYQIDTTVYKYMKISYKKSCPEVSQGVLWFLPTGVAYGAETWTDGEGGGMKQTALYPLATDGEWATVTVKVADCSAFGSAGGNTAQWEQAGKVTKIRLNPFGNNLSKDGDTMWIKYVAFFATEEEANAYGTASKPEDPGEDKPALPYKTWDEYGAAVSLSWDTIFINKENQMPDGFTDGHVKDYLEERDRTIDGSDSSISTIYVRGWIGFDQDVTAMGYSVNGGAPVYVDNTLAAAEDAVKAAGGDHATRFTLPIDVSKLSGKNEIVVVAKLADGTEVAATHPTQPITFTYQGPEAKTPDVPPTSDATAAVFMIAAAAVLVTVLLKKKVTGR